MFLSIDMKMFAQAVVYEPKIYYDSRGGFQEIYKESTFKEFNLKQINLAKYLNLIVKKK